MGEALILFRIRHIPTGGGSVFLYYYYRWGVLLLEVLILAATMTTSPALALGRAVGGEGVRGRTVNVPISRTSTLIIIRWC